MSFNTVHDIQSAYRKVVNSISRPGLISDLSEEASKVDFIPESYPSTWILARMLLDTEATFKIYSERETRISQMFNQLTYANSVETEQADFIFVLHDAAHGNICEALLKAKTGDLINPHASAMVIVEAGEISNESGLRWTGPGIQEESFVRIPSASQWVQTRAEKNAEYPLGIDMMFINQIHQLLCLPRTTQILNQGV